MKYIKEEDNYIWVECMECGMKMRFEKNDIVLNKTFKCYNLPEEVECFCGEQSDTIINAPVKTDVSIRENVSYGNTYQWEESNAPHCPTCGSSNVHKISLTSKAVGGAMFGLFSSDIRKSYKCDNCGYKW